MTKIIFLIPPTYGSPFRMLETLEFLFQLLGKYCNGTKNSFRSNECVDGFPGHRNNILSPSFTEIGVGLAKSANGRYYWTQMFIKPYCFLSIFAYTKCKLNLTKLPKNHIIRIMWFFAF